ncbi:Rha family transcriptional regulator [Aureimonas sp. Leaf324]|uniref:Rha family transcriptional regulator n=1 Tax=Aureimonas sp. Leaf324 TaxID=1736336 RepID=UPI000A6F38E3|nr:Rha family transcriptional regulator [Aureimonas sp. Leaf324]
MTAALQRIPERPPIYTRDGDLFASPLKVARYFKVSHRTVMEAIERRIEDAKAADEQCDDGMLPACLALYRKTSFPRQMPNGGTTFDPGYEMTETGVTLIGMALTTPTARLLQMRYTAEFNRMRAELQETARRPRDLVDLNDLASVQVALLTLVQDKQRLLNEVTETRGQLAIAAPEAASWDAYADADGLIALSDVGRILDVGARRLTDFLLTQRVLFRA